jgi:hypothetical protein
MAIEHITTGVYHYEFLMGLSNEALYNLLMASLVRNYGENFKNIHIVHDPPFDFPAFHNKVVACGFATYRISIFPISDTTVKVAVIGIIY